MTKQDKDIEALIEELTDNLSPVKSVLRPVALITPWLLVGLAYVAAVLHFLGIRMDWRDKLAETAFVFEMGLAGLIAVISAYVAGWLAVPDMRAKQWLLAVPATLFLCFMLWVMCALITEGSVSFQFDWRHCFSSALLMAFIPVASLTLLARRGATTRPGWMAFVSILAVGAIGWITLRLTCTADNIGHTMALHFLPYILLAVLLGALARRLYRW